MNSNEDFYDLNERLVYALVRLVLAASLIDSCRLETPSTDIGVVALREALRHAREVLRLVPGSPYEDSR